MPHICTTLTRFFFGFQSKLIDPEALANRQHLAKCGMGESVSKSYSDLEDLLDLKKLDLIET